MFYKRYFLVLLFILFVGCSTDSLQDNIPKKLITNNFTNKGFTLVYNDDLYNKKIISKKIDDRSLIIFQKNLKKNTNVKIKNILNDKSIIAKVGNPSNYPLFNNSVVSLRIAKELDLNVKEPYVEIIVINTNSLFVAKKAKTYDEEKKVAIKVPVNNISISNLNEKQKVDKKKLDKKFSYIIKIADFYFKDTALIMEKRIKTETPIKKPKIKKISNNIYRVYLGPYNNIKSLQKSFNDINILKFENIEIIGND